MPSQKPIKKVMRPSNGKILVYTVTPISPKYQEIINTIKEGHYKTRYELLKFYSRGTISSFIKTGLEHGFLKQKWVLVGTRRKAILEVVY